MAEDVLREHEDGVWRQGSSKKNTIISRLSDGENYSRSVDEDGVEYYTFTFYAIQEEVERLSRKYPKIQYIGGVTVGYKGDEFLFWNPVYEVHFRGQQVEPPKDYPISKKSDRASKIENDAGIPNLTDSILSAKAQRELYIKFERIFEEFKEQEKDKDSIVELLAPNDNFIETSGDDGYTRVSVSFPSIEEELAKHADKFEKVKFLGGVTIVFEGDKFIYWEPRYITRFVHK
ncbi:MAG: hypothetical protein GVY36_01660 [Verrucomicrobia bacterium]|jgi:hypothetical protein|nr:hypothetical protein [Verrucomicrobiota bacterium]